MGTFVNTAKDKHGYHDAIKYKLQFINIILHNFLIIFLL